MAVAWLVIAALQSGTAVAGDAADKATEEVAEKAATKAAEKAAEKVQETAAKAATEAVEQAATKAAQQAAEKTTEKVVEKTAEKAATKAVEKAAGKAAENAATKAAEQIVQKVTEAAEAKAELTGVRPGEEKGPTEIRFFVFLVDVDAIDDAEQNFTGNVYLLLEWKDERLANPGGSVRQVHLEDVWNPQVLIVNQAGLHAKALPEVVQVDPDGRVMYRQRYTGKLSQPLDLSEFPMDRQQFSIQFTSVAKGNDRLKFVPMLTGQNPAILGGGIADKFSLPDWRILKHEALVLPYEPMTGLSVPGFVLRFDAKRYIEYYIWQVVVPMAVVVVMSWAAFWIAGSEVSVRVGVATSSILTLVALRFVVANLLPRLPYMTRIDFFTVGSTVLVFLALVVVVITSRLVAARPEKGTHGVDIVARVAFPAAFVALLVWFFAR